MELYWTQTAVGIVARLTGPLNFRFVVQPIMAIILGIRDGVTDAKLGNPPFIFDLLFNPQGRDRDLKSAWKSLAKPMILAVVLDAVAQYLIFKQILVIPAIIIGTFLMAVPYAFARGITNRILSKKN
jgi:hypothetical protein